MVRGKSLPNHIKTNQQYNWTCDGPEFTLEPLTNNTWNRNTLHLAEDSLEFLEERKIKSY
jgi:HSP90 family molecular chaperone